MRLFEQDKFDLDDRVAQFIPAFTNATLLETMHGQNRQVPPKRPITVRDVLRHTTGCGYGDEASVREFYEREQLHYWRPHDLCPPKLTIARAAEALARVPALHHPGENFTYGFNTDLLGRLIEVWSGEPLDRYLQRFGLRHAQDHDFLQCRGFAGSRTSMMRDSQGAPATERVADLARQAITNHKDK